MNNFIALNDEQRQEMLNTVSCNSIDDLFRHIPVLMKEFCLDNPLSEMETTKQIKAMSKKNNIDYVSFLGGGVYNKFIPAAITQVAQRFEFLTAYTPYQPEISQGTLQVMYEFQSMICRLTGMDVSNASVYDGATACAEALSMAVRLKKKNKVLVSSKLNPEYKDVIKTYMWAANIDVEWFEVIPQNTSDYSAILIQNPDFYGEITELPNIDTLLIVCTRVSALSILKPPVEADIVVGDIQELGIPMEFGGPHAGFLACKEKYIRQLPGRIAGRTVDADGNQAFTLTLQTREQHIRREKATSNICSNQALIALCSTLYLSLLGEKGFRQTGIKSANLAHKFSEELSKKGIKTLNKNFFSEFTVQVENSDSLLSKLKENNIIGGLKIDNTHILISVTEMNSEEEIETYLSLI
ncbi:MAG: aminomethyl-transferring glycine dehydrogenase subunit GcvPA [Candidatus Gastranaerophilaceae bacterium]